MSTRERIRGASGTERAVMAVALAVLVLVVSLAAVLVSVRTHASALAAFQDVGEGLNGVLVVGEEGIDAVAGIYQDEEDRLLREQLEAQRLAALEELERAERVTVTLALQSVLSDLKIKFVNTETGRLVTGVPFEAMVTLPDGSVRNFTDEDLDGIIYLTNLPKGDYSVSVIELTDEAYKHIVFDGMARTQTVKDTLEYKQVDVSDEEIDSTQMAANSVVKGMDDTPVEGRLPDTVEFVESTRTKIGGGVTYEKIDKSRIVAPLTALESRTNSRSTGVTLERLSLQTDDSSNGSASEGGGSGSGDSGGGGSTDDGDTSGTSGESSGFSSGENTGASDSSGASFSDSSSGYDSSGSGTGASGDSGASDDSSSSGSGTDTSGESGASDDSGDSSSSGASVTDDPLKTTTGEAVYVKVGADRYVEAKASDYSKAAEFYIRVDNGKEIYKMTGWQPIDGKLYYYDKYNNRVTGTQVISGVQYTFNADGSLSMTNTNTGIDVSVWQGNVDWNAVKNAGISFVIIRVGYRGSVNPRFVLDDRFHSFMQGATAAGLKVGVYFVTQAVNEVEAVEEASYVLSKIGGYRLSLPVFLDVERSGGRGDNISVATRTAVCKAFCQTITNAGYRAGIYANKNWMMNYIDMPQLTAYTIWMAQYYTEPTYTRTRFDIWQYSSDGRIPGINARVDLNKSYVNY